MSVLSSLFGSKPRERPDIEPWIAGAGATLLVDGTSPGLVPPIEMFPERTVLRHETSGAPGLPFHDRDARRLPWPAGEHPFGAVVLADVLDKVLDVAPAVDEALRVAVAPQDLVIVQSVAPEDYEQRALWNALASMRDPRHASTPSGRQLAAIVSGLRLQTVHEAVWDEAVDALATLRPDFARELALLVAAAEKRGATEVVREGRFVVERRAWLLRRA